MERKFCDIEFLPAKVNSGEVSFSDGAWKIFSIIYFYPNKFHLKFMDEDERSEFLMFLLPKFNHIFTIYRKECGSFAGYIYGCIKCNLLYWKRMKANLTSSESCMTGLYPLFYETDSINYLSPEDSVLNKEDANILHENILCAKKSHGTKKEQIILQTAKKTALILALKASYYIGDTEIHNVANFTGYSEDFIYTNIKKLNESMPSAISRRLYFLSFRDNAFFYHRKYSTEILKVCENTVLKNTLIKKYKKYTESWAAKNFLLTHKHYKVCPSNRKLALLLGISRQEIEFYLYQAIKRNIFSKLKNLDIKSK